MGSPAGCTPVDAWAGVRGRGAAGTHRRAWRCAGPDDARILAQGVQLSLQAVDFVLILLADFVVLGPQMIERGADRIELCDLVVDCFRGKIKGWVRI